MALSICFHVENAETDSKYKIAMKIKINLNLTLTYCDYFGQANWVSKCYLYYFHHASFVDVK